MKRSKAKGIEVVVFEPSMQEDLFFNSRVMHYIDEFKSLADVINSKPLFRRFGGCYGKGLYSGFVF